MNENAVNIPKMLVFLRYEWKCSKDTKKVSAYIVIATMGIERLEKEIY
jgi:hypothetical protein